MCSYTAHFTLMLQASNVIGVFQLFICVYYTEYNLFAAKIFFSTWEENYNKHELQNQTIRKKRDFWSPLPSRLVFKLD